MPTFANTIDNNEILAKRSQCDYAGNDIQQTYATKSEVTTGLASKQDTISDLATIRSGAADGATAVQPGDLATVATTGAYSDLSGTPTIVDNGKIYGMDGTESYNDIYTKMVVDGIGITWVLNRVSPYAGKATYTACEISSRDSSNTSGYLRLTCVMRSGTASQQVTVFMAEAQGNASGFGTPTYSRSSTPVGLENQVYSWNSNGVAIARNINEVPSYTTSEDGKVLGVVDNSGTASLEWVTPAAGGVTDVEVDGTSVVSGGVASITMPTVDQTFDGTSSDAQSGVAIAGEIANIAQVPAITSSDDAKVLTAAYRGGVGSYSWETPAGLFIAQYGISTYAEVKAAVGANKDVYCDVNPSSSNKRMAFLAYIGSDNFEFQYYRSNSSASGIDSVFVYKVDSRNKWTTTERAVKAGNMPTVDQTYNSSSTNAQSGVAVAGAIANVNQVPASTSSDEGKVLTVDANGDPGWATGGGGGGAQADWTEDDPTAPSYIENKPVPKTLTAGTGISITESASTITIANTAPDLPIGSWEDVSTEAQYNTTPVLAGGFAIKYNAMLKLVSVTADVNLDAGAANIFTWSNRLKPVATAFALGNGLSLYVSQTSLNQPAAATNRWVNGVWMWPVVGE